MMVSFYVYKYTYMVSICAFFARFQEEEEEELNDGEVDDEEDFGK